MISSIDSISFEDYDDLFFLNKETNFFPKTDMNLNTHIKNIGNKFLLNSLPENIEEELNKSDNFSFNRNHCNFENNMFYPYIGNTDKINSKNNLFHNKKEFDIIFNKNTMFENDVADKHYNYTLSDSGSDHKIKKKVRKVFFVIYPKRFSLFNKANVADKLIYIKEKSEFIKKKRRRNKEDDVRRMIGRRFFNDVLYNKINDLLVKEGSKYTFEKLQQDLVYDLVKKCNKHLLNKTLEYILITKELYKGNNMEKYLHNMKVLKLLKSEEFLEIRERTQIDRILKMKYIDLFKEYISSKEFIDEIERLKNNKEKFDDSYINNYIYYTLNFIQNFSD